MKKRNIIITILALILLIMPSFMNVCDNTDEETGTLKTGLTTDNMNIPVNAMPMQQEQPTQE